MRKTMLILLLLSFSMGVQAQKNKKNKKDVKLETYEQKLSYAIGYDVAQNMQKQGIVVEMDLMIEGLKDGMGDSTMAKLTDEQIKAIFQEFQQKQMEVQTKKMEEEALFNKESGQQYINDQMKANPNLKKTESGLVYEIVTPGSGNKPLLSNTVKVNYTGMTPDGTIFDSTQGRGPAQFPLTGLIKGWQEGIQLMNVGSTFKFIIPADLAYGNNPPQGTPIKSGMTLVFEVELLDIVK